MKSNIYAIELKFPKTFIEFMKRLEKWRNIRDSLYSQTYSIRPYHSIGLDIETGETVNTPYVISTETYNSLVKQTIEVLNLVGKFYGFNSTYKTLYPLKTSDHKIISTATPLEEEAAENLVFDMQQMKNGIIQILKSYGQFDATDELWLMDSKISSYKAIDLILSEYPILPQLINEFSYPTYPNNEEDVSLLELVKPSMMKLNPILKVIWESGLGYLIGKITGEELIEPPTFETEDENGTFKLLYSTSTENNPIEVIDLTKNLNVYDYNTYNKWLYSQVN